MADSETCAAPDGSTNWTFRLGSKAAMPFITLLIACLPFASYLVVPKLVRYIGGIFGFYLRKKTAGRRAQILELVEADEKEFLVNGGERRNSDDWENVEGYAAATAGKEEKGKSDWDGIVGFFHPFW